MTAFRIATYNVHKCRGVDGRVSVARICDVMGEFGAQVVALQEVKRAQAEELANSLGMTCVFGRARTLDRDDYGNAILASFPIELSASYDLTVRGREARQCLQALLNCGDGWRVQVYCVHLGTSFSERRQQAKMLVSSEVLERNDVAQPRIVAGDFNEWTRGLATRLLSQNLQSADHISHLGRRTTYPGLLPFLHLDHIYYDPVLRLEGLFLHRSRKAMLASDHVPLVADFALRNAEGYDDE